MTTAPSQTQQLLVKRLLCHFPADVREAAAMQIATVVAESTGATFAGGDPILFIAGFIPQLIKGPLPTYVREAVALVGQSCVPNFKIPAAFSQEIEERPDAARPQSDAAQVHGQHITVQTAEAVEKESLYIRLPGGWRPYRHPAAPMKFTNPLVYQELIKTAGIDTAMQALQTELGKFFALHGVSVVEEQFISRRTRDTNLLEHFYRLVGTSELTESHLELYFGLVEQLIEAIFLQGVKVQGTRVGAMLAFGAALQAYRGKNEGLDYIKAIQDAKDKKDTRPSLEQRPLRR